MLSTASRGQKGGFGDTLDRVRTGDLLLRLPMVYRGEIDQFPNFYPFIFHKINKNPTFVFTISCYNLEERKITLCAYSGGPMMIRGRRKEIAETPIVPLMSSSSLFTHSTTN